MVGLPVGTKIRGRVNGAVGVIVAIKDDKQSYIIEWCSSKPFKTLASWSHLQYLLKDNGIEIIGR